MNSIRHHLNSTSCHLAASALVLAAVNLAYGQTTNTPPKAPASGTLNNFFNGKLPDAVGKAKINVNARMRWEHANQSGLKDSDAFTLRTRFGITSAPLCGFQGMLEGENVTAIGNRDNYNAAGSNPGGAGKTIIADPPTTELNQAWLSYTYTNWIAVKGGRQRIVLDNARFIGDVGWRQNQQTFDAVAFSSSPIKDLDFYYGYIWDVHRIFGDVNGLGAANRDFSSASHLIHLSYSAWDYAKVTGYAYLLDLQNAGGAVNSCATYGASLTGSANVTDKVKLEYRGELAWQSDYAKSPLHYDTEYYNLQLGANIKPFIVGAGYEVLGSDSGVGFKTPLATLHAFDGWDDVFLATPGAGLRDLYAFAQVSLPAAFGLHGVYHKFDADKGSPDYGQEFDAILTKKLGKYFNAAAKYAHYWGQDEPYAFDVDKFWLQVEFNF